MKVKVICLKDSKKKNFLKGNTYEGVTFDTKNFRLIGEDNKKHLMKRERFILIK